MPNACLQTNSTYDSVSPNESEANEAIKKNSDDTRKRMVFPEIEDVVGVLFVICSRLPKGVQQMVDFVKFVNGSFATMRREGSDSGEYKWHLPPHAEHYEKFATTKVELFAMLLDVTLIDTPDEHYWHLTDFAGKYLSYYNDTNGNIMWWCFDKDSLNVATTRPRATPHAFPVFCKDPGVKPTLVTPRLLVLAVQKLFGFVGSVELGCTPGSSLVNFEDWLETAEAACRHTPDLRSRSDRAIPSPQLFVEETPRRGRVTSARSPSPIWRMHDETDEGSAAAAPSHTEEDMHRVPSPQPRESNAASTLSPKRKKTSISDNYAKRTKHGASVPSW